VGNGRARWEVGLIETAERAPGPPGRFRGVKCQPPTLTSRKQTYLGLSGLLGPPMGRKWWEVKRAGVWHIPDPLIDRSPHKTKSDRTCDNLSYIQRETTPVGNDTKWYKNLMHNWVSRTICVGGWGVAWRIATNAREKFGLAQRRKYNNNNNDK